MCFLGNQTIEEWGCLAYNALVIALFHTAIYNPIYNALIALLSFVPGGDVGIAVIILTIGVKLLLFPLAQQASKTQLIIKKIAPEIDRIKEQYKDDTQAQAMHTMALYREHGVRPFSSILLILIQLPIVIALYLVFIRGGLPTIHTDLLYSFVRVPEHLSMNFMGLIDLGGKSIVLALVAGVTQFLHARIAFDPPQTTKKPGESFKDDMARSLHIQMRYVLPVIIAIVAYTTSAAVGLYFVASNAFMLIQELVVRKLHTQHRL